MDWQLILSQAIEFVRNNPDVLPKIVALLVGAPLVLKIVKLLLEHFEERADKAKDTAAAALKRADAAEVHAKEATNKRAVAEQALETVQIDMAKLQLKLRNVKEAFANGHGEMWLRAPIFMPLNYVERMRRSIPILLCANLKGGVGKTTIAANLADYFQVEHNERVLAIDLDYQGSLSSTLLDNAVRRTRATAKLASMLMSGGATGQWLSAEALPMNLSTNDSRVADCFYEFANYETKLTVDWLLGDTPGDIRYHLANVLLSEDVQSRFDRVIIDVPPRVTAGFINALCASTHLLVPTMLDVLAAEAVGTFLRYLRTMNLSLFPTLELVGVAGTMKKFSTERLMDSEKLALETLRRSVAAEWGNGTYVLEEGCVPRKEVIAEAAGQRPVYRQAKQSFKPLGDAIFFATACGKGPERPTDAPREPGFYPRLH